MWELSNGPESDWTDAEWDGWFNYLRHNREERRKTRRKLFVEALKEHKYLIESNNNHKTSWPTPWQKSLESGEKTYEDVAEHVENREYGFGWKVEISDTPHCHYRPGLSHLTVRDLLLMRGFTHVMTYGGPVPIDEWRPYGNGIEKTWRGRLDGNLISDFPDPSMPDVGGKFVLGGWHAVTI